MIESDEYTGPDMTDLGLRAQKDPAFKEVYQAQKEAKFATGSLMMMNLQRNMAILGDVYGAQCSVIGKTRTGETIDQIKEVIETIKTGSQF